MKLHQMKRMAYQLATTKEEKQAIAKETTEEEVKAAAQLKRSCDPVHKDHSNGSPQIKKNVDDNKEALLRASEFAFQIELEHPEWQGPILLDPLQPDFQERLQFNYWYWHERPHELTEEV